MTQTRRLAEFAATGGAHTFLKPPALGRIRAARAMAGLAPKTVAGLRRIRSVPHLSQGSRVIGLARRCRHARPHRRVSGTSLWHAWIAMHDWQQVNHYLDQAFELPEAALEGWLQNIAAEQPDLAATLAGLLATRKATGFVRFLDGHPSAPWAAAETANRQGSM